MTIQHIVGFGVERAGDVLCDISSDPSGRQLEEIMVKHLGRSLRGVDRGRRIDDGFKNSRPEGVEILVLDEFHADPNGQSHGAGVAYVAEQALSQPAVEVLRQRRKAGEISLAGQLMTIADSENPPEVINLSFSRTPAQFFVGDYLKLKYDFTKKHRGDSSQWSAATRQELKNQVQELAEKTVDEFYSLFDDIIPEVETAVQALLDKGVTVVMSAGKSGQLAGMLSELGVTTPDGFWDTTFGQSVYADGVIVVGATDADGQPADFSNPNGFTDVAAEGVQVPVNSRGGRATGTSFTAPKVAALAADILAIRPELTPADVEAIIRKSASPVAGAEKSLGAGRVNPDKARELARRWAPSADLPDMTSPYISLPIPP